MTDFLKERQEKLKAIKKKGIHPYGGRFATSASIKELVDNFIEDKEVVIAGRVMALRAHGKAIFSDIKDTAAKIQIYIKSDIVGEEQFSLFDNIDIGDIIGVKGSLFKSRKGEMTVKVLEFTLLSKSLRPLPEKWHGLKDVELRFRQRYLDLIVNDKVREIFLLRSKIITEIRNYLDSRGYLEVETPMMHPLAGGAAGKPFKTHHNTFDMDLYLRVAPELYLKRLLVGGFERIYEINRSFRNEGISTRHNPEFTMLEVYTAYADYEDVMVLTEELISHLAKQVLGTTKFTYQGREVDLAPPWNRKSFAQAVKQAFDINPDDDAETWINKLKKKGKKIDSEEIKQGKLISRSQVVRIAEDLLEPERETRPAFFTDYFTELCPLAKKKPDNPEVSERFELFIGGLEVANGYSELNDPEEQRDRFRHEIDAGEDKHKKIDDDFVRALEYGMPPAGGLGIGIDRLIMLFTGQSSIREVILFPQLKPERENR